MKPLLAATRPRAFTVGAPATTSSVNDEQFHFPTTSQKSSEDLDRHLAESHAGLQDGKVQLNPYTILPSEPVVALKKGLGKTGAVHSVSKGKRKARGGSSSLSRSPPRSESRSRSSRPSGRRKSRSPWKDQRALEEECGDSCFNETLDEDLYRMIKEDKALYEKILRYEVCQGSKSIAKVEDAVLSV